MIIFDWIEEEYPALSFRKGTPMVLGPNDSYIVLSPEMEQLRELHSSSGDNKMLNR